MYSIMRTNITRCSDVKPLIILSGFACVRSQCR